MKSNKWLMLICIAFVIFMLVPLGLAYFEYIAKYDVLINGDGSINQNAFGVLNSEDYRAPEYGYGTTPGNPFVVDNLDRLYNLIRLNNTGRLISSKISEGLYQISQYYFVLDFTEETLPQVLNLNGIITESVGNNEYPFVDQISGLLYAYCYDTSSYIYLSGLIDPVDVVVNQDNVTINGVVTEVTGSGFASGKYIKVPSMYVGSVGDDKITAGSNVYVPLTSLKKIHNVIANATVEVPDEVVDVGFFSTIASDTVETSGGNVDIRASVSDVIFYNLTVNCVEAEENTVKTALASVWNQIFGSHNFEDTYTYDPLNNVYYERHIGLFAGHIDGDAANITVAGDCNIHIGSKDVNYYSAFTTAGYIDENAKIGGVPFSELLSSGENVNDITGCMFADSIYAIAESDPGNTAYKVISGGLTRYVLSSIPASGTWKGVGTTSNSRDKSFTYGSFHFILSDNNDTVSDIWEGGSAINLLNAEGYVATQSVLYCNDEYRYNPSAQSGGSLVPGAASANETQYQGIHTLVASGSSLDKGKYIIVAKIPETVAGVTTYRYFALKIVAEVVDGNQIVYSFDNSSKCEITTYINDQTGSTSIYSSALWQTAQDSITPTFRNTRFDTQYLTVSVAGTSVAKELTSVSASAASFRCSVLNSTFTYTLTETTGDGIVSTDYYLNYDTVNGFYFSTERNTLIDIYRLSNGFSIELVTSAAGITENDDYLIVGKNGSDYYLLGEKILEVAGSTTVTATGTFGADYRFASMPALWSLQEYQNFRQYIWYADSASASGGSASVRFNEKVSGTYYLDISEGQLVMTSAEPSEPWVYTQGSTGGTLAIGIYSINFSYASATETNFSVGGSNSTIYIYKLVPDDDDWRYNTYQGARLITLDSSTVEDGSYLIATNTGSSYMGLVMSDSGVWGATNLTAYINGTANMSDLVATTGAFAGYKWQVSGTSAKPTLKNVGYSLYLSRTSNSDVSLSTGAIEWMYNAASGRTYYTVMTTQGNSNVMTIYYLAYNGSTFVITEGQSTPGCNYDVRLYRVNYEYVYSNVVPVQSISYNDTVYGTSSKIYFLMTNQLTTMNTKASYVLGAKGTQNESAVESINISSTSAFNEATNTLTTTTDLAYYSWYLEPRILSDWGSIDIYAQSSYSYFPAFQLKNSTTGMFLAASSAANSRTLVVATTSNMNKNPASGSQTAENNYGAMTAIGFGRGNSSTNRQNPNGRIYHTDETCSIYIMGRTSNYEYYIWKTYTPGVFALSTCGTSTTSPIVPEGYSRPYFYQASGFTINIKVAPVSEKGDNIDAGMHYMITAVDKDSSGVDQYYAICESINEFGVRSFGGINVTSQAETINQSKLFDQYGNIIEESSTDTLRMVPMEADWFQISTEKGLRFYQSMYSTNAEREYLSVSEGMSLAAARISIDSAEQPAEWYYDAISKYFKYYKSSGGVEFCWYLTYNMSENSFSLTANESQATHFYIYRFKPTYVISQVTSAGNESLNYGNFIIAYGSSGNYTGLGANATDVIGTDLSNYINNQELTETEYNKILDFIWKQQYYDFSSATYNPSAPYLQLFSYVMGGGFTVANDPPGLQTGSDPMVWTLANSGGLWTLNNRFANSNVDANSRGIIYGGIKSNLQIADGYSIYLGEFLNNCVAKLYAISNSTLSPATSISTNNNSYYVIVFIGADGNYFTYYLDTSTGGLVLEKLNVTVSGSNLTTSSALASKYQFHASSSGSRYRFYNRSSTSTYLTYSNSMISATTTNESSWTVNSTSKFLYLGETITYNGYYLSSGSSSTAVNFYYLNNGLYLPVTGDLEPGNTYAMMCCINNTYYIAGYNGTNITHTSLGTTLPTSLTIAQVTTNQQITAIDGSAGVYLKFTSAELYLKTSYQDTIRLSSEKSTVWRYLNNRLYTVSNSKIPTQYLSRSSSTVTFTSTLTDSWLYEAVANGTGGYTLTQLVSTDDISNKYVVIVLSGGYAVTRSGSSVMATLINLNGSNVTASMIWHYDGKTFSFVDGSTTKYLRRTTGGLVVDNDKDIDFFVAKYTTYAFTTNTTTPTPLYIFRVDMSTEIDAVTDINTNLGSKVILTPSVSLLQSSKYVIVALIDTNGDTSTDKYYSLGMINSFNSQSIDITNIMKNARPGTTVTLFDTCVWEQMGSDLSLIFNNCGFTDTYYLTGVLGNRDSMEPKVVHPETPPTDFSDYIWRTYSFIDNTYLFGYTEVSGGVKQVYYLYFDTADLKFKLTTSVTVAKNATSVVQLYQLGAETANQPYFETAIIETENDIIVSYPLNLAETRADLKKYTVTDPGGGAAPEVQGEYLVLAVNGVNYYALTLSDSGSLMYIDVSPYFSGNYSYDDNDNLCLSVNFNYIWRQMNEVTEVMYSPSLSFCNSMTGSYLGGLAADIKYDFGTHTLSYLSGSAMNYLNFSVSDGFTFGNSSSGYEILLYSLGAHGTDTGDTGTLNYTYYNVPISTSLDSSVTFSKFEFNKKLIPELLNYAVGTNGFIEKSVGWSLSSAGEKLSEINSSVFFTKGYTYDPDATDTVADFAEEFSQFTSPYSIFNTETNETLTGSYSYFAPAGTAAFVIDEASQAAPVFVNIVVSTQFDTSSGLNADYLRYLALWRVASLTSTTGTATALKPYSGGDGTGVLDYAYTFGQKLRTPDFAIPLPNHYGSAASGASYAYVDGQGYVLSDAAYNTDYLIAHTFVITEPGVYYLGSTYGSVAISYISIDNMAEGEATGGVGYGSDFSIDFCYGSVDLQKTAVFDAATADGLLDSLTYVGSDTWYHSNIFPMFINGNSANPTDRLDLNVVRVLNTANNTSSVNVNAYTKARIAGGILYSNNNSIMQRAVRKVTFNVYCDGLAVENDDTVFWTASKDESSNRFRLYSTYVFSDVLVNNYFLNAAPGTPSLSAAGIYYWTCDSSGHLVSQDGTYLTYSGGVFSLSPAPSDSSVLVNKYEGGTPTVSASMTNGGIYFLTTPGGDMVVIRPAE